MKCFNSQHIALRVTLLLLLLPKSPKLLWEELVRVSKSAKSNSSGRAKVGGQYAL